MNVGKRLDAVAAAVEAAAARRTAGRLAAECGVAVEAAHDRVRWAAAFRRAHGRLPTLGELAREAAAEYNVSDEAALAEVERVAAEWGRR